ncbi:T9SS type A sorting domain-containing protein [Marinoscillum furvescens]|uniref:Putative secreted protein (Por secretion system target) n=1 Tax=Marinoscillum furvescens DSM 4134 TaxID=1122208 RepID=A0A3D9L6Y4_MARFU|nr:T9SS type A sorting domain-containing protein [Marinoscillum furvescens]REE02075.1 putative secreted protein (Por secretion system target) [Marinoscillum furvescens DSM 4134]
MKTSSQHITLITLLLILAFGSQLHATSIPGCSGGTVENNVEDGVEIKNGDCGILSSNIGTIEGNIEIKGGGELTIDGNINTVEGNITICTSCTLIINGDISQMDGSITNNGTLIIRGSVTSEGKLEIKGKGTTTLDGGSFTSTNDTVELGPQSNLDLQNGSSISVSKEIVNKGTITSDETGNTISGGIDNSGGGTSPTFTGCGSGECTDNSTLPITLGSFELTAQQNTILLSWTTLSEINFEYFEIQRASADGDFETIATLAGNGTTSQPVAYTWTDEAPLSGINYYRLISNDYDGYREVFEAKVIEFNVQSAKNEWKMFPSVISPYEHVSITGLNMDAQIAVYSTRGQVVNHRFENGQIELTDQVQAGVYIVRVSNNGITSTKRLVIR